MARSFKKIELASYQAREWLLAEAVMKTGVYFNDFDSKQPDFNKATSIVIASDSPLDLLIATNEARGKLSVKSRAKKELKQIARADDPRKNIQPAFVFLAHALTTGRRDDAETAEDRRREHEYLALLNAEFPLTEQSLLFLEASRHPDPWVRGMDSFAMSVAFGALSILLGDQVAARELALFDEGDEGGWPDSYLRTAHWLGISKSMSLEEIRQPYKTSTSP